MTDYKFHGWVGKDKSSAQGKLVEEDYEPKKWEETDVDIEISHCGICGSDLHTLSSGWKPAEYPVVVGHEIVGRAVKVGSKVEGIKVGDRVGVGAQSDSCLKPDCEQCSTQHESYCPEMVQTFDGRHKNGDKSYGGYGDYSRVPGHFVINLEKYPNLPSDVVAPMLCGGVTTYSPLKNNGAGPGKTVGIVGIGGLGHFGLMWAKALNCDKVVAISRKSNKKEDALKLGADSFIATDEDKDWPKKNASTIDLIVSTVSSPKMPIADYLMLLKPHGVMIQVGAPEDNIPAFNAFSLIQKGVKIGGSAIGSPTEIREMLALANDQNVKTWINKFPLTKVNDALKYFNDGNPRYRIVLVNEKHAKDSS